MSGNQAHLGDIIRELLKKYDKKGRLEQIKIKEIWEREMGPVVARHTANIRLHGNQLFIYVDSASLRQELSYAREKIRNMLNENLEGEQITEVFIR